MRRLKVLVLYFLVVLEPALSQEEVDGEHCEKGWHYSRDTGYCYLVNYAETWWNEASTICQAENANLTSIHSLEEDLFIQGLLKPSNLGYWIGARFQYFANEWQWSDGTRFNYNGFNKDLDTDACSVFWRSYDWKWSDSKCGSTEERYPKHPFVCKKIGIPVEGAKSSGVDSYSRHWWWCLFGSVCGPNCCSNNDCCSGPDVCASGVTCSKLKCQHRGGNNCGEDCCEGSTPICCDKGDGTNVCVESSDACNVQQCTQDKGVVCGTQCCTGNSFCCDTLDNKQCVQSLNECNYLDCIEEKGQVCGDSCCKDGQMCCNGTCTLNAKDCLQQECLEKGGEVCGRSCCTGGLQCCAGLGVCGTPLSCQKQQCNINPGDHWCNEQHDCCTTESWVCCQAFAPATCAANLQHCNLDLAQFAEAYAQKHKFFLN